MLKRFNTITILVAILLVPALVFSADKFAAKDAVIGEDNTITVPLEIANDAGLMAVDIPLQFSEGVTLKEVSFENTRVEDWDLKLANIDNEKNVVIIGLVNQLSATKKATLEAGYGTIANLVFEVDNSSVSEVTISPFVMEKPHHELMFIYNTRSNPDQIAHDKTMPEFEGVTIAFAGLAGQNLPTVFALEQNYPNPFNPTTDIAFSLPSPSSVELTVYNVIGQQVTTLVSEDMPAGNHTVTWDGRNSRGGAVSSGVYFYRIQAENFVETKKMMMLK